MKLTYFQSKYLESEKKITGFVKNIDDNSVL